MLGKDEGADNSGDNEEDTAGGRRASKGIGGRVGFKSTPWMLEHNVCMCCGIV